MRTRTACNASVWGVAVTIRTPHGSANVLSVLRRRTAHANRNATQRCMVDGQRPLISRQIWPRYRTGSFGAVNQFDGHSRQQRGRGQSTPLPSDNIRNGILHCCRNLLRMKLFSEKNIFTYHIVVDAVTAAGPTSRWSPAASENVCTEYLNYGTRVYNNNNCFFGFFSDTIANHTQDRWEDAPPREYK